MPQFEPGHQKFGGRKKDSLNKFREPIRQMYAEYVLGNFDAYKKAMEKLSTTDPAAYVRAYNDAVKHTLPALQSIELTTKDAAQTSLAERINSLAIEAEPEPDK